MIGVLLKSCIISSEILPLFRVCNLSLSFSFQCIPASHKSLILSLKAPLCRPAFSLRKFTLLDLQPPLNRGILTCLSALGNSLLVPRSVRMSITSFSSSNVHPSGSSNFLPFSDTFFAWNNESFVKLDFLVCTRQFSERYRPFSFSFVCVMSSLFFTISWSILNSDISKPFLIFSFTLSTLQIASSVEEISTPGPSIESGSIISAINSDKCVLIPRLPDTTGRDGTALPVSSVHPLWSLNRRTIFGTSMVEGCIFLCIRSGSVWWALPIIFEIHHTWEFTWPWRYLILFQSILSSLHVWMAPDLRYWSTVSTANLLDLSVWLMISSPAEIFFFRDFIALISLKGRFSIFLFFLIFFLWQASTFFLFPWLSLFTSVDAGIGTFSLSSIGLVRISPLPTGLRSTLFLSSLSPFFCLSKNFSLLSFACCFFLDTNFL